MSNIAERKPHAVFTPYPAQGHVNPLLQLAKLLHLRGFHITFVHTEYNYKRLLKSRGPNAPDGLPDFQFETIPDGLNDDDDADVTQHTPSLRDSIRKNFLQLFRKLLHRLNRSATVPPVTCLVSDSAMFFTIQAAEELGVPNLLCSPNSASTFLSCISVPLMIQKGLIPFKARIHRNSSIVFNTLEELEGDVLNALSSMFPSIYVIGLFPSFLNQSPHDHLASLDSNLWKEDAECLEWLESKEPRSVVYVNFGNITVMSTEQLLEFAWGLANSKKPFLWIIRPDLVIGGSVILSSEFVNETRHRSLIANQPTNCRYICNEWEIGIEIDANVKREEVEKLVNELMVGEKGKKMRPKAMELKKKAEEKTKPGGCSFMNLDEVIKEVLLKQK
ncbi:hypothetical protein Fmac_010030 [Flemingia macrophylla]|uniref:Uncharacterized protein n=1 Tax=Flemingia macrophylla TaxID=520843 RepID=A0ABD1N1W4_9FABA